MLRLPKQRSLLIKMINKKGGPNAAFLHSVIEPGENFQP
jgi:hypothetical protein